MRKKLIERGKNGLVYKGFVCIGRGCTNIHSEFGLPHGCLYTDQKHSYRAQTQEKGNLTDGWIGNCETYYYYITEQLFNEKFPVMIKDRKFKTKSPAHSVAIQTRLFELGYVWSGGAAAVEQTDKPFLYAKEGRFITQGGSQNNFDDHAAKLSTLEDLYEEFKVVTLKLNSEYSAEIHEDHVKVGCQQFSKQIIKDLAALL